MPDGSITTQLGPDGKPKKRYRPGKRQRDQEKRKAAAILCCLQMEKNLIDGVDENFTPENYKVPMPRDEETATLVELMKSLRNPEINISDATKENLAVHIVTYLQLKSE